MRNTQINSFYEHISAPLAHRSFAMLMRRFLRIKHRFVTFECRMEAIFERFGAFSLSTWRKGRDFDFEALERAKMRSGGCFGVVYIRGKPPIPPM